MILVCTHSEDNARFLLLAVLLICYMLLGALLFQQLESDKEIVQAENFWRQYNEFRQDYLPSNSLNDSLNIDLERLHQLLYAYGNATMAGSLNHRRRWDFSGSFHFVGTIVSTIGYGNSTPQTTIGRVAVIIYGFLGCSGGILFFNLFLERIITLLAWIFRTVHLRRLRKNLKDPTSPTQGNLPDILDDETVILQHWKPSVYWVMFSLTFASTVVALIAAAVYSSYENWDYSEAIYFCFVSFATIGFGDYVSTQQDAYPNTYLYRFFNFIFLVVGCCCLYSLLNVTSIIIKQVLNWIVHRIECRCRKQNKAPVGFPGQHLSLQTTRRSQKRKSVAAYPSRGSTTKNSGSENNRRHLSDSDDNPKRRFSEDSLTYDDSDDEKGLSGGMTSVKDFLKTNKVSLAMMQQQLYETAQMQRGGGLEENSTPTMPHRASTTIQSRHPSISSFRPGIVGPLAICSEKFHESAPVK